MLETAKLLQAELQLLASTPAPAKVTPTKIAVMMPSAAKIYAGPPAPQPIPEPRKEPAAQRNGTVNAAASSTVIGTASTTVNATPTSTVNGTPGSSGAPAYTPAPETLETPETPVEIITLQTDKPYERGQWPFDPLAEKPTDRFTLSQRAREVNDVIGSGTTSLNEKLKSDVADLKSALNDTPVRDLKKAIGVNDRYVFINQLFRGDEAMYERSLKTINGFRILPEAEYWMERELKVKLGWDENREATRHFYQIVKRRFS